MEQLNPSLNNFSKSEIDYHSLADELYKQIIAKLDIYNKQEQDQEN